MFQNRAYPVNRPKTQPPLAAPEPLSSRYSSRQYAILKRYPLSAVQFRTGSMLPIPVRSLPLGHDVTLLPRTEKLHIPRPNLQDGPSIAIVVCPNVRLFQLADNQHAPAFREILVARLGQALPRRHPKPDCLLLPLPVLACPRPRGGNTEIRYRIPVRQVPHLRIIAQIPNQSDLLIHCTVPSFHLQLDRFIASVARQGSPNLIYPYCTYVLVICQYPVSVSFPPRQQSPLPTLTTAGN